MGVRILEQFDLFIFVWLSAVVFAVSLELSCRLNGLCTLSLAGSKWNQIFEELSWVTNDINLAVYDNLV